MKKSKMMRTLSLVLAIATVCASLAACGSKPAETKAAAPAQAAPAQAAPAAASAQAEVAGVPSQPAKIDNPTKDVLNFGVLQEPATMDPIISTERITYLPEGCVFDSLFERTQDNQLLPKLCESYEISEDGLTYTLKIRQGIKFHNGDPLTTEDVAFTIGKLVEAQANNFSVIDTVEAVDDTTVVFTLKYPFATVLFFLALPQTGIVNKALYEKDPEAYARNPVGTGAFKFDNWVSGSSITLQRNEEYWREPAALKTINFITIPEESTGLVALESGELDCIMSPSISNAPLVEASDNLTWLAVPGGQINLLCFNNGDHPDGTPSVFKDNIALRQAICYAINKDEVAFACTEGQATAAQTPYADSVANYPQGFMGYPYDPEMAKQKLAEAGYPDGFSFKARSTVQAIYAKPAEIIQGQLAKVGINMELETMERGTYLQEVTKNSDFDMTVWALVVDVPDADHGMYKRFHSDNIGKSNMNYMQVNDPDLDAALMKNRTSSDNAVKAEAVKEMTQIVHDKAYAMGLYQSPWTFAFNKGLTGIWLQPTMHIDFYDISWAE